MSGYVLTYGGFLLFGGRAADLLGRRRLLLARTSLFALSSLTDGVANSEGLGPAVGVFLGGVPSERPGWRWVFFVNIPICLIVLAGSVRRWSPLPRSWCAHQTRAVSRRPAPVRR